MPNDQPSRLGRYELREVLGRGAMGVVYKGYDSFLDRVVAIKTYRQDIAAAEEARRRFEREVRTASKLVHPNIVVVHDGGLEGDVPYLAMEFVEGPTLQAELERRGRLPVEEALSIALAIGEGLAYAHSRGVVHRDLKPANILLAPGGEPKIADFGVAKLLDADVATRTAAVGTPRYMAPEQIEGRSISPAADVFAFAVLTYEMLTGKLAFSGDSLTSLINKILNTEPEPPTRADPKLPKALDAVITRALAKDPATRTQDVTTFVSELRAAFSGDEAETVAIGGDAESTVLLARPAAAKHSRSVWPIVLALLLVAGGIGGYFVFGTADRSGPRGGSAPAVVPSPEPTATFSPRPTPTEKPKPTPTFSPHPIPTEEPKPTAPPPSPAPTSVPPTAKPKASVAKPTASVPPKVVAPAVVAPPQPVAASASFDVTSEPPGAEVLVDGASKGRTPLHVSGIPPGSHQVEMRMEGHAPYQKTMRAESGHDYQIRVTLAPGAASPGATSPGATRDGGFVSVVSQPPGAEVKLDGVKSGTAPANLGPLPAGPHTISAEMPGFPVQTITVNVKPGGLHSVKFTFGVE